MIWRTLNVNSAFGSGIRRTRTLNAVQRSPTQSSVQNGVLNGERTTLAFGVQNAVPNGERSLHTKKIVGGESGEGGELLEVWVFLQELRKRVA